MSDLISRQAAIDAMESINDGICEQQAIDALCELPSAQPEIIRCKDCDFWNKDENILGGICDEWSDFEDSIIRYTKPDDYCSFGERKE